MALKLSLLLQAVDRISGPVGRARDSMRRMGAGADRAGRDIDRAGGRTTRFGARVRQMGQRMRDVVRRVREAAGPRGMDLWGKALDKAGFATGRLIRKIGGLALGLAKIGGAAAAGAGTWSIFEMFRTASQFEQFQIMLENMEGSAEKARSSMAWVRKFAETTPYELAQVMEAFVQLKAYGIDPMDGSLRALGDASAGMSKELMAAVEALADAQTGEFERLKEFGIRARTEGDKVTFTYMKNGREISSQARNNAAELKAAIVTIMSARFDGMMDRQSKTFSGMFSNLKDQWTVFLNRIADAGIFDKVKGKIAGMLETVNKMAEDGRLQIWAERIGKKLEQAFDWAWKFTTETDWQAVATGMMAIVEVLGKIIGLIGRAATAWSSWQSNVQRKQLENIRDGYFTPDDQRAAAARALADMDGRSRPAAAPRTTGRPKPGGWIERMGKPISVRPAMPKPRASADKVQVGGQAKLVIDVRGQGKAKLTEFTKKGDVPWSIQIARSNWQPS